MPRKSRLGRLLILFGPEAGDRNVVDQHVGRFRTAPHQATHTIADFHANSWNDDPSPFQSMHFGSVVESLLQGRIVIVGDRVFEDERRRGKVALAFRRTFPDLAIDHVQVGGGAELGRPDERITFDADVYDEGIDGSNEQVVVESDADRYVLSRALSNASQRMMKVDEDGQEHPDHTLVYTKDGLANLDSGVRGAYTPNHVSAITEDENGDPGFSIDCKGAIEPAMAAAFRKILVEELRKQGIASAHVRVRD